MTSIVIVLILGLSMSPLSCLMLWNRYISFTDSLVHACVFGGLINYIFDINLGICFVIACLFILLIADFLNYIGNKTNSSFIRSNILYLCSMAVSGFAIAFKIDYSAILFGNIFFINEALLLVICLYSALVFLYMKIFYQEIIIISLNKLLAQSLGIKVRLIENLSLIIIILGICISIYTLGGGFFIIAAMMLPGMIANNLANSPNNMIIYSLVASIFINIVAIYISEYYDLAFSAITIVIGFMLYILSVFFRKNS